MEHESQPRASTLLSRHGDEDGELIQLSVPLACESEPEIIKEGTSEMNNTETTRPSPPSSAPSLSQEWLFGGREAEQYARLPFATYDNAMLSAPIERKRKMYMIEERPNEFSDPHGDKGVTSGPTRSNALSVDYEPYLEGGTADLIALSGDLHPPPKPTYTFSDPVPHSLLVLQEKQGRSGIKVPPDSCPVPGCWKILKNASEAA